MSDCPHFDALVEAAADGLDQAGGGATKSAVAGHLTQCPQCAARWRRLAAVLRLAGGYWAFTQRGGEPLPAALSHELRAELDAVYAAEIEAGAQRATTHSAGVWQTSHCPAADEIVAWLISGESIPAPFQSHLEVCAHCRTTLGRLYALVAETAAEQWRPADLAEPPLPPALTGVVFDRVTTEYLARIAVGAGESSAPIAAPPTEGAVPTRPGDSRGRRLRLAIWSTIAATLLIGGFLTWRLAWERDATVAHVDPADRATSSVGPTMPTVSAAAATTAPPSVVVPVDFAADRLGFLSALFAARRALIDDAQPAAAGRQLDAALELACTTAVAPAEVAVLRSLSTLQQSLVERGSNDWRTTDARWEAIRRERVAFAGEPARRDEPPSRHRAGFVAALSTGEFDHAARIARQNVLLVRAKLGGDGPWTADALADLGSAWHATAVASQSTIGSPDPAWVAPQCDRQQRLWRYVHDLRQQTLGDSHPATGLALAEMLSLAGHFDDAVAQYQQSLGILASADSRNPSLALSEDRLLAGQLGLLATLRRSAAADPLRAETRLAAAERLIASRADVQATMPSGAIALWRTASRAVDGDWRQLLVTCQSRATAARSSGNLADEIAWLQAGVRVADTRPTLADYRVYFVANMIAAQVRGGQLDDAYQRLMAAMRELPAADRAALRPIAERVADSSIRRGRPVQVVALLQPWERDLSATARQQLRVARLEVDRQYTSLMGSGAEALPRKLHSWTTARVESLLHPYAVQR